MISFSCPQCQRPFEVQADLAGKKAKCPGCQALLRIPEAPNVTTALPSFLETPPVPSGPPVIPGYEILGELGRGGMGVVYRGRQIALDRLVAIKTVPVTATSDKFALDRLEKEARSVAQLRHPNIVTAYDFGRDAQKIFFVMELLEGEDMEKQVSRHGPLDETTTWALIRQAAAGLAHALEKGIIHRDIKPANLLLVAPAEGYTTGPQVPLVKITDFGLVLTTFDSKRITAAGTVLGTPLYMAPEQFSGDRVDARADIYALGMTACHLLGGRAPYAQSTIWELLTEKAAGNMPSLPNHISTGTRTLIERMLAHNPDDRIGTYGELFATIDALLSGQELPPPAQTSTTASPPRTRSRFRLSPLAGALAVLGLLCLGGLGWYLQRPPPPPSFVSSGLVENLFDGQSLKGWTPVSGQWQVARTNEGGFTLEGQGLIRRPLPPTLTCLGLVVSVDRRLAAAVELHFGLAPGTGAVSRRVLRLTDKEVALGDRADDEAEFRPRASLPVPREDTPDSTQSRELRIERQGNTWYAFYEGKLIGSAPARRGEQCEFRLRTEGLGTAHFDTIQVTELVPPEQARR